MKRCKAALIFIGVCAILCSGYSLNAASVSVGANLWYNWWQPAWQDCNVRFRLIGSSSEFHYDYSDFQTEANFLYGPVLSLTIWDRLSISSVFMYGKFNYTAQGLIKVTVFNYASMSTANQVLDARIERSVARWDSDTTISYLLFPMVYVFGGFKAQGYSYNELYMDLPVTAGCKSEVTVNNYGPGIGIGLAIPIWGSLFLQCSGSGILLFVHEEYDYKMGNAGSHIFDRATRYLSWGVTSSASLVYLISDIHTTIKAGFRYQYLSYRQRSSQITYEKLNGRNDHIYGITFSATYTFYFGN
ncbi:MAG: hypothetical protein JXA20_17295 [Spirochaetes bacterium]|nr:hypothetical protein [Spirochaetota bacterium]